VVTIIVSKSKSRFYLKSLEIKIANATFKLRIQRLCNTHVSQLLYNSDSHIAFDHKKHIIMCFSDKRLLLFTAIVTDTIFVYKWTKHFRYCSVVHWSKIYKR